MAGLARAASPKYRKPAIGTRADSFVPGVGHVASTKLLEFVEHGRDGSRDGRRDHRGTRLAEREHARGLDHDQPDILVARQVRTAINTTPAATRKDARRADDSAGASPPAPRSCRN